MSLKSLPKHEHAINCNGYLMQKLKLLQTVMFLFVWDSTSSKLYWLSLPMTQMQQILLGKQNIALGHGNRNYLWKLLRDLWLCVGIWVPRTSHRLGPLVAPMDVYMLLGKPNIALGHGLTVLYGHGQGSWVGWVPFGFPDPHIALGR